MRLPLQKQTRAQRQRLLRQLIWSLCLVAPGSLTIADEGTDKKPQPSSAPALTLPTFPSSLPPAPTAATPKTPVAAGQAPKNNTAAPALLPTLPANVATTTVGGSSSPVSAPATINSNANAKGTDTSKKEAVIISMPRPLASDMDKSGGAMPAPAQNQPATKPNDQVSIKFGSSDEPAKLPSSFRLSDKTPSTPTSAAGGSLPSQPAPVAKTPVLAPTIESKSESGSSASNSLKFSDKGSSDPRSAAPTIAASPNAASKTAEPKTAEPIPAENRSTTLGSLTISKEGVGATPPAKSDAKREAVLIRPKAVVLGRVPTELANSAPAAPVASEPKATPMSVSKPSTSPQTLAGKSEAASSAPMKSVASKLSPLPPSQLASEEKLAIKSVEPNKSQPEFQTPPVTIAAVPKLSLEPTAKSSIPVPSAVASLPMPPVPAPAVASPAASAPVVTALPVASSLALAAPVATAAPQPPSLGLAEEAQAPVVSDVVISPDNKLASAKKYSKPADRTIQVGTVALTTMRVGEKDILKCEVDDTSVCRAIVTADGEVALLPGKVGVTRATLWVKEPNGQSKVETADIQVGEVLPIDNADSVEIGRLNESLRRLYPNTTLQVVASDRCIEICGEADTEQQAREVLQLVRKLCLVPVKDKVTVR